MLNKNKNNIIDAVEKVTRNPLIEAAKEFKNPSFRFILIAAIFIIGSLVSVVIFFFRDSNNVKRQAYETVVYSLEQVENKYNALQYSYDSLKDAKTKALYDQAFQFLEYKDSMNNELRIINKTLTSK